MKKLWFSIFSFLVVGIASAHNLELGINMGLSCNTDPFDNGWNLGIPPNAKPYIFTPGMSVKIISMPRNWQLGISVDVRQLAFKDGMLDVFVLDNLHPLPAKDFYFFNKSVTYLPVKVFINRRVSLKKVEIYAGISGGIDIIPQNNPDRWAGFDDSFNGSGVSVGMQAGATYRISKRLGINAEFCADYIHFTNAYSDERVNTKAWAYPITAGIRYKLNAK